MRARVRWRADMLQALEDVADGVHSPLEYRYLRDVERAHGLPTGKRQAHARQKRALRGRGGRGQRAELEVSGRPGGRRRLRGERGYWRSADGQGQGHLLDGQ
jgi:hypothetical protein